MKSHLTSQTRVGASGQWFPPRPSTVPRSRPPSSQRSSQCVQTAHAGCSHHLSLSHTEEHICILLSLRVPREGSRFEMQMFLPQMSVCFRSSRIWAPLVPLSVVFFLIGCFPALASEDWSKQVNWLEETLGCFSGLASGFL